MKLWVFTLICFLCSISYSIANIIISITFVAISNESIWLINPPMLFYYILFQATSSFANCILLSFMMTFLCMILKYRTGNVDLLDAFQHTAVFLDHKKDYMNNYEDSAYVLSETQKI